MITRALKILLVPCVAGVARAQSPSVFAGDWKLDPARSTLTDRMVVTSKGGGKFTFNFGGGDETIVVDGTDQPTPLMADGTLSVGHEGDAWRVVRKLRGRITISAVWTLSPDSSLLTDHFTSSNADGSSYQLNYVYERRGGGPGFAGTWVSKSLDAVNYVIELGIRPFQTSGLALVDSAAVFTGNLQFPDSAVRRLDARSVELMKKKGAGLVDFVRLDVSPNGDTLRMTPPVSAAGDPRVFVFERQLPGKPRG